MSPAIAGRLVETTSANGFSRARLDVDLDVARADVDRDRDLEVLALGVDEIEAIGSRRKDLVDVVLRVRESQRHGLLVRVELVTRAPAGVAPHAPRRRILGQSNRAADLVAGKGGSRLSGRDWNRVWSVSHDLNVGARSDNPCHDRATARYLGGMAEVGDWEKSFEPMRDPFFGLFKGSQRRSEMGLGVQGLATGLTAKAPDKARLKAFAKGSVPPSAGGAIRSCDVQAW